MMPQYNVTIQEMIQEQTDGLFAKLILQTFQLPNGAFLGLLDDVVIKFLQPLKRRLVPIYQCQNQLDCSERNLRNSRNPIRNLRNIVPSFCAPCDAMAAFNVEGPLTSSSEAFGPARFRRPTSRSTRPYEPCPSIPSPTRAAGQKEVLRMRIAITR